MVAWSRVHIIRAYPFHEKSLETAVLGGMIPKSSGLRPRFFTCASISLERDFQSKWEGPRPASDGMGAYRSVMKRPESMGVNFELDALSRSSKDGNPVLSMVEDDVRFLSAAAFTNCSDLEHPACASRGDVYFTEKEIPSIKSPK